MRFSQFITLLAASGGLFCLSLQADWVPGDPHKMHYPQLPDPTGWDVKVDDNNFVADDFRCTQSGPITDIHFWGSWRNGIVGTIQNIQLTIWSDNPNGPNGYSIPEVPLSDFWQTGPILPEQIAGPFPGDQGWFDPVEGVWQQSDHLEYFQYNIKIDDPNWFIQEKDTIYWLEIHVVVEESGLDFGWKTSLDHFNDDSVARDGSWPDYFIGGIEIIDPETGISMDQAFVIVPELPTYAVWTGMVSLMLLLIRRRRRS
ncbi:MAG: hypothetical protein ACP5I4_03430 [Oceanipulchritudo sp.]